jgi:hypothetical protein
MRHATRLHLVAGATCILIAGMIGFVIARPPAHRAGPNPNQDVGESCARTALSSYRTGNIVWDGCGLSGGESGVQLRGQDGSTLYGVRYDYASTDMASRALAERLGGHARSAMPWDVRQYCHVGDIWIAEFNTAFPLADELDQSRWPLFACAQLNGPYVDVVYGATRADVIALHEALAEANWTLPAGTAPN